MTDQEKRLFKLLYELIKKQQAEIEKLKNELHK